MKNLLFAAMLLCFAQLNAQVGIGTNTPDASAQLDIVSTSKGMLVPRVTAAQRTSIASPATGLLVYQTDGTAGFYVYKGSAWYPILDNSTGYLPLAGGMLTGGLIGTTSTFTSVTSPLLIGGTGVTSSLTYKTTTGAGAAGADHIFQVGTNGGTEAMRIVNSGKVGVGTNAPNSTLQVNGSISITPSMGIVGGANSGSATSLSALNSYIGLQPSSASDNNYSLPLASTCPGRIIILRNNSATMFANIYSASIIYYGSSNSSVSPFVVNTTSSPKTVMIVSDGANWTIGRLD